MRHSSFLKTVIAIIIVLFTTISSASLVDRYSFTADASDSVGDKDGTLEGDAVISNNELVLDGTDDWVTLPADVLSDYTSASIEMWLTLNVSSGWLRVFDFGDTSGSNGGYYWFYSPSGNNTSRLVIATAGFPGYSTGEEVITASMLPTAAKIHIVCVYDETAGQMRIYQDGTQVAYGDVSMLLSDVHRTYAYIGKSVYTGDPELNGSVDEFRIYNSVLTASQIQQNYEWGPNTIASPDVIVTETGEDTSVYTGGDGISDTYQIQLAQQPTANVTITATPPATLNLGNGAGVAKQLTFTASNWDAAQTITVSAADPGTPQELTVRIAHTAVSPDSNFNGINIYDTWVYIKEAECGALGYLEGDYNLDCYVNLPDFALLAQVWLDTEAPLDLDSLAGDWLKTTMLGEGDVVEGPLTQPDSPYAVDTTQLTGIIDEKVYGHFLEHIYHSANGGLWGELVWNRSFENYGTDGQGFWYIDGDELAQSSTATDVHLIFGDTSWTDYELTLQAQKDSGSEGFLILFRAADSDNFYWLNLGGWSNTKHAIEKEINGSRSTVSSSYTGSIIAGQWYSIRIRCEGNNFQAYLDDVLIVDYTDSSSPHTAGAIGLGTWATQARYRNIQVTRISDSEVLFSGLPELPSQTIADSWTSFGDGQVTAQEPDARNDDYCVLLTAASGQQVGIEQTPFKFTTQSYSGSLWAKGSASGLLVQMLDGETVVGQATLAAPTSVWQEYTFQITPSTQAIPGTLRISLIGAGSVYIDQVSLMGQDAIDTGGYRPDLLQAVQDLKPPVIRWPGGCYASAYFWKDGIGQQEDRKKYPITLWEDQDTNSYGTDEFLRMCELTGIEPILVINTGLLTGTCGVAIPDRMTEAEYIQDAVDWMEYCNGPITSTWGALRAANGHPEPYNVKYWEIDNETWSTSYGGGVDNYIDKLEVFIPAVKAYDPNAIIIACGGSGYDQSWNQTILDNCPNDIDYISIHYYEGTGNYATGPVSFESHLATLGGMIAASSNPEMKIFMSEWNLQSTDWRTGLYAGGLLNAFERQSEYLEIGTPALFLRHTSASDWDNAFINFDYSGWFAAPNYIVMKLWNDHYAPYLATTTGGDSDLNVVSTLSEDEQTLNFKVVNPTSSEKSIEVNVNDSFVPKTAYLHYVAPGSLDSRNTLESKDTVRVQAKVVGISGQTIRFLMPAYSAGVVTVTTDSQPAAKLLYSYFQGNGDGLHLAYSTNGKTWADLNGDATLITPTIGSGLMRDPSICRGPDGMFHMVWTTGWYDDGIGIAHSADLINWSEQTYLPVMADQPYVYNCWAPEIFYDDVTGKYLIFWASTLTQGSTNDHRIYYITTEDFVTYTDTAMFYDPGFSCIDAFIAKDGNRYVMVLKDERDSGKNIRITFSDYAEGPYTTPPSASITPSGLWVEGPSLVKIGQDWILYYDAYTSSYMGGQSSTDLSIWTDIRSQISFPSGTRHGTVFSVPTDVLIGLMMLP